ncbi:hypothetical protein [Acinetobacter bereziniae]|uniref:hypothetical protein n=1 Tax=Acinetobacter bereziniae TaxID=106648 RepID=UPI003AF5EB7D
MNEIFNQRIQSIHAGKDITHAQIVAKRNLREELDVALAEYLANGGEIKQAQNQQFQVKHGTSDQYKKRSCRCDACVAWAVSAGLIKKSKTKVTL